MIAHRILLGAILAAFGIHVYWLNCVADDAYITYRFARNVAEGHGFVWNVGEAPVEGFTNLLWLLICTGARRLGLELPRFTQWLGFGSGIVTLIYGYRLARSVFGLSRPVALFTTALTASAGPLACWAGSGMETVFFAMWVLLAVFHAGRFASTRASRDPIIAAVCLFLATLTRPEGFGVFGIVLVAALTGRCGIDRPAARRGILLLAGVYMPLFAAYFTWRYSVFGYVLPNTFYAKTGGGYYQYRRGVIHTAYFAWHFLAPCVLWPILAAWRRNGAAWSPALHSRFGLWLGLVMVVSYTAYIAVVGGDYMAMYRFFVPVLPILYALVGVAVQQCLTPREVPRPLIAAAALVSLGGILLQSTPLERLLFTGTPGMHGTYRGVLVERWHVNRFHVIAPMFHTRKRSEQDSLLTYDIGVTGYVLRMRVYDALGIVDPVIAHQPAHESLGQGLAGHEKQDLAYSFSRSPTFFMYTVQLRPAPASWPRLGAALEQEVRTRYEKRAVWLNDHTNGEQGYFTYLERKR